GGLLVPALHAVGVAVADFGFEEARLAIADDAQHGDPVQELAAYVAGAGHALAGGGFEQIVDFAAAEEIEDGGGPAGIGCAGILAARSEMSADIQRPAAAAEDGDFGAVGQRLYGLADHLPQGVAALGAG